MLNELVDRLDATALAEGMRGSAWAVPLVQTIHILAIAVARGDRTVLGSIGITAPSQRLRPELVPAMATAVKAAAKELSEMLGYRE